MDPTRPIDPAPASRTVVPWNKGAFVGPKPPLKPRQVWSIRLNLQRECRLRDLAMFDLAIDSKLRGCDLVAAAPRPARRQRRRPHSCDHRSAEDPKTRAV